MQSPSEYLAGDWWHVPPQSQQDSRQDVDRRAEGGSTTETKHKYLCFPAPNCFCTSSQRWERGEQHQTGFLLAAPVEGFWIMTHSLIKAVPKSGHCWNKNAFSLFLPLCVCVCLCVHNNPSVCIWFPVCYSWNLFVGTKLRQTALIPSKCKYSNFRRVPEGMVLFTLLNC